MGPSGPMVSECSSLSTGIPVFVVVGGVVCRLFTMTFGVGWISGGAVDVVPPTWGTGCRGDERVFATATDRWRPFVVDLGHREEAAVEQVSEPQQ
jgi:hypothetical protein